jgi:hypothetical protein
MNTCFIHTATIGNYQLVLNQIFELFNESQIINDLSNIYINICGNEKVETPDLQNIKVLPFRSNLNRFEFSTLNFMKEYCNNYNSNILYLHLKGITNPNNICIEEHKNYMFYFNILKYKNAINLLNSNDAVGVDLVNDPVKHFSGNIWWSKSEHIKNLKTPESLPLILSERHKCEFWICSEKNGKYESIKLDNTIKTEIDKNAESNEEILELVQMV